MVLSSPPLSVHTPAHWHSLWNVEKQCRDGGRRKWCEKEWWESKSWIGTKELGTPSKRKEKREGRQGGEREETEEENHNHCPGQCFTVVRALVHAQKGSGFISQSRAPTWVCRFDPWLWSLVGAGVRGNQSMFHSLSPPSSLLLLLPLKISERISSGED